MSVTITLESIRGPVDVEIHRDGTLSGEDLPEVIDYDRTMVEFGEKQSWLVKFVEEFIEEPIMAMFLYIEISPHDMIYIAADWAEHVLWIIKEAYPEDTLQQKYIQISRDYVDDKIDISDIHDLRMAVLDLDDDWREHGAARQATRAVRSVVEAARDSFDGSEQDSVWSTAERARLAVADYSSSTGWDSPPDSPNAVDWNTALEKEYAWQIRRLVDCMEAVQAGKDWPDLKDTQ